MNDVVGGAQQRLSELAKILRCGKPVKLERLVGRLLGRLLEVPFRFARAGEQHGGDGATREPGLRAVKYEARRYGETTRFDERGIVGQIEQAVVDNPDLEAWVLATTREVPEQTEGRIAKKATREGIAAVAIDWSPLPLPRLAALCASDPNAFEAEFGCGHRELLAKIAAMEGYGTTLAGIKRDLENWSVGYELVRKASHLRLEQIWRSRRAAGTHFGQDVAGGSEEAKHVRRAVVAEGLDGWFDDAKVDCPALVVGQEGMGKTWSVMDWLQARRDKLPIVVLVPASGVVAGEPHEVLALIGRYLQDLNHGIERPESYWAKRVRRLLERPEPGGPTFVVYFDGLNQRRSYEWATLLRRLFAEMADGRARVVVCARTSFVDDELGGLADHWTAPARIEVGRYGLEPGGEFDQKLAMAGIARGELSDELIDLARVPRLFDLVVELKAELGGTEAVTRSRLLWKYGASAVARATGRAFNEQTWRAFVRDLAAEFLDSEGVVGARRISELSSDAVLTVDQVYRRVSLVKDGVFSSADSEDDVEFEPEFVHYALGLALVKRTEAAAPGAEADTLARFLEPIAGLDERVEIVRAAVSIALCRDRGERRSAVAGALCTAWVRSQEFPPEHEDELRRLAPELVDGLLDAVEACGGYGLSGPRYRAINALDSVDKEDGTVAQAIAERAARWCGFLSRERWAGSDPDRRNYRFEGRRKRLLKRVGTADVGRVLLAGHEFEIVDARTRELMVAGAQLLQGRPLVRAIRFLEVDAIRAAVDGEVEESVSWLNMLNAVDPSETAALVRERAEAMAGMAAEGGVHPDLYVRAAALMLWRTGYQEDDEEASRIDPNIDGWPSYESEYLANPGESHYPLERRHAGGVLRNDAIPVWKRIARAREALLDPSLDIPPEFATAVVEAADRFDFSQQAIGRQRHPADSAWEETSLALARCAPIALANTERRRLREYGGRRGEGRFGAAMEVPGTLMLVGEPESVSLSRLRAQAGEGAPGQETWVRSNLLVAEIQHGTPVEQIRTVLDAGLEFVDRALAEACGTPTKEELDGLLGEYGGEPGKLLRMAELLARQDLELSERAFDAFAELLEGGAEDVGAAWVMLAHNAPSRLAARLDARNWTWSADKGFFENMMGSHALAMAKAHVPFVEFAQRVAPARLLTALSRGERSRSDVELGVEMLGGVLDVQVRMPEPLVDVAFDRDAADGTVDYRFSFGRILKEGVGKDAVEYDARRQELVRRYADELGRMRREGAQFRMVRMRAEDFDVVWRHCPTAVDAWLEGMEESSSEFARRVRLADGFYVALCEALLARDPTRGVVLWEALRTCLKSVRFTVRGDADLFTDLLLAAKPCEAVDDALVQLYESCRSDRELIDFVVAARCARRSEWVAARVALDAESACPVDRLRSVFVGALLAEAGVASGDAWPQGRARTVSELAWMLGQREAFALHRLREFVESETEEAAHAAWRLFKACADRRAWCWMDDVMDDLRERTGALPVLKLRLARTEEGALKRAMNRNEKEWTSTFAFRRYPKALGPWNFGT